MVCIRSPSRPDLALLGGFHLRFPHEGTPFAVTQLLPPCRQLLTGFQWGGLKRLHVQDHHCQKKEPGRFAKALTIFLLLWLAVFGVGPAFFSSPFLSNE